MIEKGFNKESAADRPAVKGLPPLRQAEETIVCIRCLYLMKENILSPQVLTTGHSENILLHNV